MTLSWRASVWSVITGLNSTGFCKRSLSMNFSKNFGKRKTSSINSISSACIYFPPRWDFLPECSTPFDISDPFTCYIRDSQEQEAGPPERQRGFQKHSRQMAKYLQRPCPKCNGYIGIVLREPGRNTPFQAINGRCLQCGYRLAWIAIRGKQVV